MPSYIKIPACMKLCSGQEFSSVRLTFDLETFCMCRTLTYKGEHLYQVIESMTAVYGKEDDTIQEVPDISPPRHISG